MEGLLELDRIGKLIAGKYRLELVLGRGGMGTVYRATHTWTGRPVAVKYLHPEHAQDAASVGRFLREARAAASVRHPNAVDVLDMGQDDDGSAYLVLELLEGGTLSQYLAANGRMDPPDAARILVPVIEALDELHRVGVVHRDFKPANIFLARAPRGAVIPKLLDFGVAKLLDENAGLSTTTGIVVGTPAYMAPEQAAGNGDVGPWTDVWAAGAVLYECLVGELPFAAPTPSLMLVNVMTKTAAPLAEKRPDLSAAVCQVVDRALNKDAKLRFESAAVMADALREAAGFTHAPGALSGTLALPPPSSQRAPKQESGVQFAPAEAPTVAVTPSALRAAAVPKPAHGGEAGGEGAEQNRWSEPNGTGRLKGPGSARKKQGLLALAVVALGLLGVGLWWLRSQPETVAVDQARDANTAAAAAEHEAAVPQSEARLRTETEPEKPALAAQPDAASADRAEAGEAASRRAPTEVAEPKKASARKRRGSDVRRARETDAPAQASAQAAAVKPADTETSENPAKKRAPPEKPAETTKPQPSGKTSGSEGVGPPRLVREW